MAGLSYFRFFPRDWHLDTRNLSQGAKGIYIDILSAMYAKGGSLPYDERELCGVTGCQTVRSLRPLLAELIKKEKLYIVENQIINNRTLEEIEAYRLQKEASKKGGETSAENRTEKDVPGEYSSNTTGTQDVTRSDIEENQTVNINQALSHKPEYSVGPKNGHQSPSKNENVIPLGKQLFDYGVTLLDSYKIPANLARSFIAKLRKDSGLSDAELLQALEVSGSEPRHEIKSYISKVIEGRRHKGSSPTEKLIRDPDAPKGAPRIGTPEAEEMYR